MPAVSSLDGAVSLTTTNGTVTEDIMDAIGADGATFNSSRDIAEVTKDGDAFKASVGGWYEWSVSVPFRYPGASPAHSVNAAGAFLSGSGLYVSNIRSWTLTVSAPYADVTSGNTPTSPAGRSWVVSDVLSVTGSYTCLVDDTALLEPITDNGTGTFNIVDHSGGTNEALAIPTLMTGHSVVRGRGSPTAVTYSFEGTGAIQHVGTSGGGSPTGLFGANGTLANLTAPVAGEESINFDMSSDARKITGAVSWQTLSIARDVNGALSGTLELRGNDDYTIA